MANKVIHLAHCTYVNSAIDYDWNKEIGTDYHELENLYAITLIKKDGATRQALATVVVKTNLGQTHHETGQIFSAVANTFEKLKLLPTKDVSLISSKVNTPPGFIPTEGNLLNIMTDMYTQNSASGSA
jgi:hypothetical protein